MFCCTDIGLGTDKWEIARDRGWSRSCISGCAGLPCCSSMFAAERNFHPPSSPQPQEKSLRVFAPTAPAAPSSTTWLGGVLRHPTARVTSHRPHRAGARAECPPGSVPGVGAAAGAQSPKMKGGSPGPAPLQQQPLGWPGDCGGCGQLPNPSSAPWGAAAFDKASQPSRAWLVDLITVFYCAVEACWFLGEMPCGVRQSARTPLLGLAALPGGCSGGDAAGDAARPPPVPRHHGERASPIPPNTRGFAFQNTRC